MAASVVLPETTGSDFIGLDRRAKNPKVKYSPEFTFGNIATVSTMIVAMFSAFGIYTADQTKRDGRITSLEQNRVDDRLAVKESLTELKQSTLLTQAAITELSKNVAVLNARISAQAK